MKQNSYILFECLILINNYLTLAAIMLSLSITTLLYSAVDKATVDIRHCFVMCNVFLRFLFSPGSFHLACRGRTAPLLCVVKNRVFLSSLSTNTSLIMSHLSAVLQLICQRAAVRIRVVTGLTFPNLNAGFNFNQLQ